MKNLLNYFQKQIISEIVDKFPVTSTVSTPFIQRIVLIHTTKRIVKKVSFPDALLRKRFILENLSNTTWSFRKIYHTKVGRPGTDAREFSMRYHTCLTGSSIYNFLQILNVFLKCFLKIPNFSSEMSILVIFPIPNPNFFKN